MQWAYGLSGDDDPRIQQATYNIFSDMGVQPETPDRASPLDPAGSNQPPVASFTTHAEPGSTPNVTITFNALGSTDPDGTIVKYEWDLDGDGTYETNTGTTKTVTTQLHDRGHLRRAPAGHRQRRRDRRRRPHAAR